MKTKINRYLFYMGLLNFILFSSCKDEEPVKESNQIIVDGLTFPLKNGYVSLITQTNHDFTVWLSTANLTLDKGMGVFIGEGDGIIFHLRSLSANKIYGVYEIHRNEAVFWEDYGVNGNIYKSVSGSITITKSGSKYKILFSLKLEIYDGGKEIEVAGSFVGLLEQFI